jgi:hypothetical protein
VEGTFEPYQPALDATASMKVPSRSEEYCQSITPALQPSCVPAVLHQLPKSVPDTHPVFDASAVVTGLPTTIFEDGTAHLATISDTDVPVDHPLDSSNKVV